MSVKFESFIPENKAPLGATKIGFYQNGELKGYVRIPDRMKQSDDEPLYCFGVLSDIHLDYEDYYDDYAECDTRQSLQEAMDYFDENEAYHACVCGGLTANGDDSELCELMEICAEYNTPVYANLGMGETTEEASAAIEGTISEGMYYYFEQDDDVFIMFGYSGYAEDTMFSYESLQWLEAVLEENRNKRCFLFIHVNPDNCSGNAYCLDSSELWGDDSTYYLECLLLHYENIILFHGNTNISLNMQSKDNPNANTDTFFNIRSIHVPSLAFALTGDSEGNTEIDTASHQGYLIKVFQNSIVAEGVDFATGKKLPLAIYEFDTTLKVIEEGTFSL